jgi:hypothetical protein
MSFLGSLFSSSKSSNSTSTNTTNQYDQRQIVSNDRHDTTSNFRSDYSVTNNVTNADAAAINKQNTDFLRAVGADQSDATKAIAQLLMQGYDHIGDSFTDVSKTASNNQAAAWTHTIDAADELLGKVVDATNKSNDASRLVAQAAIASYQPSDNKLGDAFKYAAIAAAAVVALMVFKKG